MKEIEKIKVNMYITRNVEKHQIPTIEISVLCLYEHVCSLHLLNAACSVTAATASPSDPALIPFSLPEDIARSSRSQLTSQRRQRIGAIFAHFL